ncbi:protein of unknown function DUF192 [Ammonifex degensii KC4]|uniref:DUF192 domain-containing protein n=1 Tax=Ammonifex degensii (strain DSM 10501 / KC4) TaxID=429009 RepID=C9RCC8_AMMDK|nr:DUF192 domain-containing protein [Ammonifex degensii]ACX51905.1 protein of unknown function DUF192 [Ammonifex degensii KC4]
MRKIPASRLRVASTFFSRLRGLTFRRGMLPGEALLLYPRRAVHTCFVRFPVDVVFLSREGEVVRVERKVPPWRVLGPERRAYAALELPAGAADLAGIEVGQSLEVPWRGKGGEEV